jgi:hypothetical protein
MAAARPLVRRQFAASMTGGGVVLTGAADRSVLGGVWLRRQVAGCFSRNAHMPVSLTLGALRFSGRLRVMEAAGRSAPTGTVASVPSVLMQASMRPTFTNLSSQFTSQERMR